MKRPNDKEIKETFKMIHSNKYNGGVHLNKWMKKASFGYLESSTWDGKDASFNEIYPK